ncbi:MAG: hypothetical protein WC701_10475 [Kiritimatiellales bacterium]
MNSDFAEKKSAENSPARFRRPLIILLFVLSISGFASTFLFKTSASPLSATLIKPFKLNAMDSSSFSNFIKKPDVGLWNHSEDTVVCQGTVIRENSKALALVNGKTVAVGGTVNGIRILEITDGSVLVECNGEIRRLVPGKSFTPGKK